MDHETIDAMYVEFVDCLLGTYTERDPESKAKKDLRDQQAAALKEESAFLWLESYNFAAVLSNGLGLKRGPEAARVVDELAELTGPALVERVSALQAEDKLPLTALPQHPAEVALSAVLSNPILSRDGERIGYAIYRDCAVILKRARRDPEVREFIYAP